MRSIKSGDNSGKKIFKKGTLIWILGAVFVVSQVFYTIQTATNGGRVVALEEEANLLQEQNRSLQDRLIEASSLNKLSENTESKGFVKADNMIYIKTDDTFAQAFR